MSIRRFRKLFSSRSNRKHAARRRNCLPRVEQLEHRIVLSTVTLTGSNVTYNAGVGEVNNLTIFESGGILTFRDTGATIVPGSGFTVVSPNEVTIPVAGITSGGTFLQDLDDTLDASGLTPASGITRWNYRDGDGNDTIIGSHIPDTFFDDPGLDHYDGLTSPASFDDVILRVADADMVMTDTTITIGTEVNTFTNVEVAGLTGGASDNVIDASAVTGATGIKRIGWNGQAGDDTLIGSQVVDQFADGPGNDHYDGQGAPVGQSDLLTVVYDLDITLSDTTLEVGGDVSTHANIEIVGLFGGASDNTIDASGVTTGGSIGRVGFDGRDGNDTLIGSQLVDNFTAEPGNDHYDGQGAPAGARDSYGVNRDLNLTATDAGITVGSEIDTYEDLEVINLGGGASDNTLDASGVTAASGVELVQLFGGDGDDTLIGSQVSDFLEGGSGSDVIDGQGDLPTGGTIFGNIVLRDLMFVRVDAGADLTATNTTVATGLDVDTYVGIESIGLNGDAAANTLDASAVTALSGVATIGYFGSDGDDLILPAGDTDVGAFIDGGAGFDTLDYSVYPTDPMINVTGPGTVDGDQGTGNGTIAVEDGGIAFDNVDEIVLPVGNNAPEITDVGTDATLADKAIPGETVTLSVTFTDSDATDMHTATIDWGDGTVTAGVVNSTAGTVTGDHSYSTGGIFNVTVTVDDGSESDLAATTSVVTGVRLTDSGVLQVIGSASNDWIHAFRFWHNHLHLHAHLGGVHIHQHFDLDDVTSLQIVTCEGNDHIHLSRHLDRPANIEAGDGNDWIKSGSGDDIINAGDGRNKVWAGGGDDVIIAGSGNDWLSGGDGHDLIRAGAGDDHIDAGRGNDIVLGEAGRDWINGGRGRDVLIGGANRDYLFGSHGDDLLIGGTTDHDANDNALRSILAEWNSNDDYLTRVSNIRTGGGSLGGINLVAGVTVHDDNARDVLKGHRGRDWFFADRDGLDGDDDRLRDRRSYEEINLL